MISSVIQFVGIVFDLLSANVTSFLIQDEVVAARRDEGRVPNFEQATQYILSQIEHIHGETNGDPAYIICQLVVLKRIDFFFIS